MHDLISKYFSGEITGEEKEQLFFLMESDADLRNEFSVVQNIRALSSWLPSDDDEVLGVSKLLEFKQAQRKKSYRFPYRHVIGYAAAICLAILSTWMVMSPKGQSEEELLIAYEEFTTPSGQRAKVKLHDGTVVWLNARSSLRYPSQFAKKERKVELSGEAFFEVALNKEKPFVVSTEKLDIKVLGTKFNVFAYHGHSEFHTFLVEGEVKIYESQNEAQAVFMQPNERVDLVGNKLVKRPFSSMDFLLWREGIYAFDDATFSDIVKKLELYYDIAIKVNDKKLDTYRFSGKFRQRDGVESVLRTLQKVRYFAFSKNEEVNEITIH